VRKLVEENNRRQAVMPASCDFLFISGRSPVSVKWSKKVVTIVIIIFVTYLALFCHV
jgi:hypothetical protein